MKSLCAGVIWVCLLLLGCAVTVAAQSSPLDAFTPVPAPVTIEGVWTPNWIPTSGWLQQTASCVYYPTPYGGRNVGFQARHYSSCGFPYTNTMTMKGYNTLNVGNWSLMGLSQDWSILYGGETYYYLISSICKYPHPNNFYSADIRVEYTLSLIHI